MAKPTPKCAIADHRALSADEWTEIAAILGEGGAVDVASALTELPRAPILVLAKAEETIVGLGAIKRPRPDYARLKMASSGHDFDPATNELGYVALAPDWKGHGYSGPILDALLDAFQGSLFSTTDSDAMMHMLGERGFQIYGRTWPSGRGLPLSLWMRTVNESETAE